MTERARIWTRLCALVKGEVSTEALEAYRRAGSTVYDLLDEVEDQRLSCKVQGRHPWTLEAAKQVELLCAWNAFALQTLGDQLLVADERADPSTVGYVPPVTSEQVLRLYSQVEGWLNRARQAQSNPAYRCDVELPAELPPWVEVEPCPRPHLEAMLETTRALRTHAEAAMATFAAEEVPAEQRSRVERLRQLLAEANAKAAYAEQLWGGRIPPQLHEQIERHLKGALEGYYRLGQLLAMPELVDRLGRRAAAATDGKPRRRLPRPGEAGFDPWCLTDPATRASWQRDAEARAAIEALWAHDPNPDRTLAIQEEIESGLARGDLAYATGPNGERVGSFYCCPWPAIYVAKRPLTLGGRRLTALQQFTYDVSAEEVARGGRFRREIVPGSFTSTSKVDYCNPLAGDDD